MPDLELPPLNDNDLEKILPEICLGLRSLDDLRNADWLSSFQNRVGYDRLSEIERLAPAQLEVPSGNQHKIAYAPGKPPTMAVRIRST
jgi:ATP-dependent helicase HrpB